jgi:SWI/SNF-related matrix-associated actin-dependent regulator 1 of chromatin subfamily A
MGLGKTVQACALLRCYEDDWPALVITPSSLRGQWEDALKQVSGNGQSEDRFGLL